MTENVDDNVGSIPAAMTNTNQNIERCAKLNNTIQCDGLLVSSMHLIVRDWVIRVQ